MFRRKYPANIFSHKIAPHLISFLGLEIIPLRENKYSKI